jgi:YVTN family beta-propeller protein
MKRHLLFLFASFFAAAAAVITAAGPALTSQEVENASPASGKMVIANRASGSISVIDTISEEVTGTYDLPSGPHTPEPMYVAHSRNRVFVGDRANDRVVVFDGNSFTVETTVPAGRGIFHMWADTLDRQLWVNNDIDKTATVIDPITLEVLATVPMPSDLVAAGGKPHDVILDPLLGQFAYVTMDSVPGAFDYVVKYSTRTFQEVGRAAVGKAPHVSAARQSKRLYVTCQGSNIVIVLNRGTLDQEASIPVPGAHGAGMARNGHTFYTSNFPGGGSNALYAIDTDTNTLVGEAVDTPFATPHNIVLTPSGRFLYLTHSSATSNKVTIYKIAGRIPVYYKEVTVGFNPFGIAYAP